MSKVTLQVTKKAGEHDTLYGSVTTAEIADLLAREGFEVDRRKIHIAEPIKTLGSHGFQVKIHRELSVSVGLQVIAEGDERT